MLFSPPVKHRHSAFTLIELVVVLVIIGVLSSMMVAEMSGGLRDSLLRGASRQLISVFNLASSRAIAVNRLYRVRFDRMTGHYMVEQHARGDDFVPARGVPDSEGAIDSRISFRIQESETQTDSAPEQPTMGNSINFYPDGTADGREIELRDREGVGLALRVSPVTARVQIIELPRP